MIFVILSFNFIKFFMELGRVQINNGMFAATILKLRVPTGPISDSRNHR